MTNVKRFCVLLVLIGFSRARGAETQGNATFLLGSLLSRHRQFRDYGFAFVAAWLFLTVSSPAADAFSSRSETNSWAPFLETNFPFFSSVVDARMLGNGWSSNNVTPRALVLNLGSGCWASFDTDLLRVSAIWTGNAVSPVSMSQISYHSAGTKAKEGEDVLPQIVGSAWRVNGIYPGFRAMERACSSPFRT
jgi:hypothetical protein